MSVCLDLADSRKGCDLTQIVALRVLKYHNYLCELCHSLCYNYWPCY